MISSAFRVLGRNTIAPSFTGFSSAAPAASCTAIQPRRWHQHWQAARPQVVYKISDADERAHLMNVENGQKVSAPIYLNIILENSGRPTILN